MDELKNIVGVDGKIISITTIYNNRTVVEVYRKQKNTYELWIKEAGQPAHKELSKIVDQSLLDWPAGYVGP